MLPDSVKKAAELAGGKRVVVHRGEGVFEVSDQKSDADRPPTMAEMFFAMLQQRDRDTIDKLTDRMKVLEGMLAKNAETVETVRDDNKMLLKEIADLRETMMFPVVGERVNGKLVARRVKQ